MLTIIFVGLVQLAQAAPQQAPLKPERICRENEQRTGSHMRTGRVCRTKDQWDMEDAARDRIPPTMRIKTEEGPKRPQ